MTRLILLLQTFAVIASVFSATVTLQAQSQHPVFVEADYTWIHTNLLPGCNCFGMQGGSAEAGIGLSPKLSALVNVTVTHRGGLTPSGYSLTQSDFTAGLRYAPRMAHSPLRLFGEVLGGGAHAEGSLAPAKGNYGSDTTFAFQTGGGISIPVGLRWAIVPAHIDYVLTTFGNGNADHQNQFRYSAGVQFQLRR